ncbi:MAG: phosphonate metabolism transcriptional regulator PhnF, partial [Oceanidesulfovibrio sp.]
SEALIEEIQSRHQIGDFLESERKLAERFGVNRLTIRRAVDELVDSGLVDRQHGRGVAVIGLPLDYQLGQHTRFTETVSGLGHNTVSSVLKKGVVPASEGVARRLGLNEHDDVIRVDTIRCINDIPVSLGSHYLPMQYEAVLQSYEGGSLHSLLQARYGAKPQRKYCLISTSMPLGDDARLLRMPRNSPVLRIKSLNVDPRTGEPVEYALARVRGEVFQLRVDFCDSGLAEPSAPAIPRDAR